MLADAVSIMAVDRLMVLEVWGCQYAPNAVYGLAKGEGPLNAVGRLRVDHRALHLAFAVPRTDEICIHIPNEVALRRTFS